MVFLINFDRKAKLHIRGGGAGTLNMLETCVKLPTLSRRIKQINLEFQFKVVALAFKVY